ncbi:hypothetical protein [Helicobacter pullorum]|uniref:hypothetical protein n=1 Tax=Helicobacter pullorum TaxID=35818 RepID=UPI0015CF0B5E|nr:hypothetical protein [Helicobacter pullorum]
MAKSRGILVNGYCLFVFAIFLAVDLRLKAFAITNRNNKIICNGISIMMQWDFV